MEYRICRDGDYPALRRLWGQCFGEEEPWTSWYFSHHYKTEHTWVGIKDGTVAAQAHLLPHQLYLRGAWRQAAYFVGVCVDESLRGGGYGRAIMATALAELRKKDIRISILQPRWPEFYRPLGWDYCYSRRFYHLPLAVAEALQPETSVSDGQWLADVEDFDPLPKLYEEFVQPYHGYVDRRPDDWRRMLADHRGDGGRVGLLLERTRPAGYVLYKVDAELIRVREMVWHGQAGLESMWKRLLEQAREGGACRLEWEDPSGDSGAAQFVASHSEPFLMGRLTDCQAVLTAMDYPAGLTADLSLELTDPLAAWNAGRFRWKIGSGRCSFAAEPSVGQPDIILSVALLSQLYFGQQPVGELWKASGEPLPEPSVLAVLTQIFPPCRNFISEYF